MLVANQISHSYGRRPALSGVSLSCGSGITGLVGQNGAGKSTLLRIAAGLVEPTSGAVQVDGLSLRGRDRGAALRRVALMPQTGVLPRSFTAAEFVGYLTWMRGIAPAEARRRADAALTQVGLAKRRDDRLHSLSGGMQRRVWLAQAVAARPAVLLLDEPSTGLDPRQRQTMVELIGELGGDTAIVLSSHVLEDVTALADHLVVLSAGRVSFDGDAGAQSIAGILHLLESDDDD